MDRRGAHHDVSGELGIYVIPADSAEEMRYEVIANRWQAMKNVIGGYITYASGGMMPELPCGCPLVMVMDEEALLKGLRNNVRATHLLPHINGGQGVFGTAFVIGQGLVNNQMITEVDFFGLPPTFHDWEGPGHPVPTNNTI